MSAFQPFLPLATRLRFGRQVETLLGCEPGFAADEDQLSSRFGLKQVGFDGRPVLGGQAAEDFGDAAVLAGPGQLECARDCR